MQEMRKAFDEAIQKFDNVETFILFVADKEKQLSQMSGKCKKALAQLAVVEPGFMEVLESALATAKVQIKINELLAEVEKQGFVLPEMDDDTEVEAAVEAEEKE